jgi:hypothetical protein
MNELTPASVADLVRRYLKDVRLGDGSIYLEVDAEHVYRGEFSWRVPVHPSRWPQRMFEYYEVLAEVEQDIAEKENLNVLFSTGEPLTEEAEAEPAKVA